MQLLSKPSSDTESATIGTTSLMPGKGFCMFTSFGNHNWIIDSGATDHITYDLSLLHNVKAVQVPCYITLSNGKKAQVKNIGSLFLNQGLELENVLHIPEFQFHLLSISKLTQQFSANVIFTPTDCLLQGPTLQKAVTFGRQHKGLHILHQGCEVQHSTGVLQQTQQLRTAYLSASEL